MDERIRGQHINDFDSIADIYDELVDWAPYERWIPALERRLRHHGLPRGAWILDAACGTGLSVLPWLERGYHVVGVDASAPMLRMAEERARRAGCEVEFLRQDLLRLSPGRTFDAAICMHSGLDYLLNPVDLAQAFVSLRGCLKPGGLLAFDKCLDQPDFYRTDYSNLRSLSCGTADFDYHWDREAAVLVQRCTVIRNDGTRPLRREFVFHLKATRPDQLIAMVEHAGFELVEPPRQFRVEDPGMGVFRRVKGEE